jgi:hypothetical protein
MQHPKKPKEKLRDKASRKSGRPRAYSDEVKDVASPFANRLTRSTHDVTAGLLEPPVFSILFNFTQTQAHNKVAELIWERSLKQGKAHFYHLVKTGESLYQLRGNHDNKLITPLGKYAYIILSEGNGQYSLRIGKTHHYFLSAKSFEVVAAGDIEFEEYTANSSIIKSINDQSGGYHFDDDDELVQKFKKLSISGVFERVGLPFDKFHSLQNCQKHQYRRKSI